MPSKPSPPPPGPTLPCEQCGYVNEPERVYCHNCGSKLDRSLLPKVTEKQQEHPEKVRKRVAKMTNPSGNIFARELKALFKVAIFSALLAAAILFFWPPDGLPELKKGEDIRLVSSDMMEVTQSPTPRAVSFSDNDINQYLKKMFKPKDTMIPGVQVVGALVACHPGYLQIYCQYNVFGLDMYGRIDVKPEVKDGKFSTTIVGGAFDRLSIDPQLMQYCDYAFGTLWEGLDRDRKQMDKMLSVKPQEGRIDLVSKGMNATPAK